MPSDNKKWELTIDEEQARLIILALDTYARMCLGQFNILGTMIHTGVIGRTDRAKDDQGIVVNVDDSIASLKKSLGMMYGESHALCSHNVSDDARMMIDIHDVIRHRISHDLNPSGGITVNFDKPGHYVKSKPLPTIKLIGDNDV